MANEVDDKRPFGAAPCPACKAPSLERVVDKGVRFVGCTACFGLLVGHDELGQYVEKAIGKPEGKQAFKDLLDRALAGKLKPGTRRCPAECEEPMARFGFGESPFVIVDRCATHGVWLDRTELKKVVRSARGHAAAMGLMPPPSRAEAADDDR